MRQREKQVLIELLKNAKLSDRDLAKKITPKASQSSVTRIRNKLEKKIIKGYHAEVNLPMLNLKIMILTFCRCREPNEKFFKLLKAFIKVHPSIIFVTSGEGMDKTKLIISLHEDIKEYLDLTREMRDKFNMFVSGIDHFIVSTDSFIKPLSFLDPIKNALGKD